MKNHLIGNCSVFGIIVLFIGASITPSLYNNFNNVNEEVPNSNISSHNNKIINDEVIGIESNFITDNLKIKKNRVRSTEVFHPTEDTFVDEWAPNNINGAYAWLIVRRGGTGFRLDSLLRFNISLIPSDAVINSATVYLYYYHYNDGDPVDKSLSIHRITEYWEEETTKWTNRPNYNLTATSTVIMPSSTGVWVNWDVTDDVQSFVEGAETNYGWNILDPSETGYFSMIYFRSKEYNNSDYHPYLEIEYETEDNPVAANWLGDQRITNTLESSEKPTIKTDSRNNLHIIWQDDRDSNWEIYYKKLNNYGGELVNDTRLTFDLAFSRYPTMEIDSNDNVHVAWEDNRSGNYEIFYTKLDTDGNTLIDDLQITNNSAASRYPKLGVSNADNIHLTWQDNRSGNWEIYYIKINNSGVIQTDVTRITNETARSEHPSLDVHDDNIVDIIWHDDRDGNYEIYYDDAIIDIYPYEISYISTDTDPDKRYLAVQWIQLNITIRIANHGDIDVYDVPVVIYVDESEVWNENINLTSGENTVISFGWIPEQTGYHNMSVKVDPEGVLNEKYRFNNNIAITIPVVDPANVFNHLMISGSTSYVDSIIACDSLTVSPGGVLLLDHSHLIMYGLNSEIRFEGDVTILNTIIDTSHYSEYIDLFFIDPNVQNCEIRNSQFSQVGGIQGVWISHANPANIVFSGNTIDHSEHTAFTCSGFAYTADNLTIRGSGIYDFSMIDNAYLTLYDSYFDVEKVHVEGGSNFNYYKHIKFTIWDENNTPVHNAQVIINNSIGDTIWTGYTNETGETNSDAHLVFEQSGSQQFTIYLPYDVTITYIPTQSHASYNIDSDAVFDPGRHSSGPFCIDPYKRTKYAILVAGYEDTSNTWDQIRYWNNIEYMYHILKMKGYKEKNIKVLFLNGKNLNGQEHEMINNSATIENLNQTLQYIGGKIRNDATHKDTLFIFTTDHGASGSYLCMQDGDLRDTKFAEWFNSYIGDNAWRTIFVMVQCYSGGFIDNLHGPNRVIITSTTKDTWSWSYRQENDSIDNNPYDGHGCFPVEFTSALHNHQAGVGKFPDGHLTYYPTDHWQNYPKNDSWHNNAIGLVNLDDDQDGFIDLHEAFDYALDNDKWGPVDGRYWEEYHKGKPHMYSKEFPLEVGYDVVAMSGASGYISVYYYDGDGTFSGTLHYIGGTLQKIFVSQMTWGFKNDIVLLDSSADQVKVLINNGKWSFLQTNYSVGNNPQDMFVADFNRDSVEDVVTANTDDKDFTVLLNNGDGTLGNRTDYSLGSSKPLLVAAVDLNADRYNDIIIGTDNSLRIYLNNGNGKFTSSSTISLSAEGTPTDIVTEDIDCDNDPDLIVTTYSNGHVIIYKNNGTGTFTQVQSIDDVSIPGNLCLARFTNDSYPDLVLTESGGLPVKLRKYNNTKGAQPFTFFEQQSFDIGYKPRDIFNADLDGDSDQDIIIPISSGSAYDIYVFKNSDFNREGRFTFTRHDEGGQNQQLNTKLQPWRVHGTIYNFAQLWYL